MSEPEEDHVQPRPCCGTCPCRRCSATSASQCGGCGRCCGKTAEYVVIDSFVWPPWPESPDED